MESTQTQRTTKSELLKLLSRFNDDDIIEIAINQYNKAYPVAYADITDGDYLTAIPADGAGKRQLIRINVSLPDNMGTVTRKNR